MASKQEDNDASAGSNPVSGSPAAGPLPGDDAPDAAATPVGAVVSSKAPQRFTLQKGITNNESFTCLWTGLPISRRYGIEGRSQKGNKKNLQGAFLDVPCAAAYLTKQFQEGMINKVKFNTLMNQLKRTYADELKGTPYERNIPLASDPSLLQTMGWQEYQKLYMPKEWLVAGWGHPQTIKEYSDEVAEKVGLRKRRAESDPDGASAGKKARAEKNKLFLIKENGSLTVLNEVSEKSLTALTMSVQEEVKGTPTFVLLGDNQMLFFSEIRQGQTFNRRADQILRKNGNSKQRVFGPAVLVSQTEPDEI